MREAYVPLEGTVAYLARNDFRPGRPGLLCLHGLGDSGLAFRGAFEAPLAEKVNLLVPDLCGFGRSGAAGDYSMAAHVARLDALLAFARAEFGLPEAPLFLLGHSMGGIPAVLLAEADQGRQVRGLVLVEAPLTQQGLFVSAKARAAGERGEFDRWFEEEFMREVILGQYLRQYPFCGHYYASLRFCRREAFLAGARDIMAFCRAGPGEAGLLAEKYAGLPMPRVYCYAEHGLAREARRFLRERDLATKSFETDCHFIMQARPEKFYAFLEQFLLGQG